MQRSQLSPAAGPTRVGLPLFPACINSWLVIWALLGCFATSNPAFAQSDQRFQMPADPSVWINSPPITTEMLDGKAAVLYFYEET